MNQDIIPAHGGTLIQLELTGEQKLHALKELADQPALFLGMREQSDLLLIATGAYSPLRGFMKQADYLSVLKNMRLHNGIVWGLPITLSVDSSKAHAYEVGEKIALLDEMGHIVGSLHLEEKYRYDKEEEALQIYGTTDLNHPGVKRLFQQGDLLLGGEVVMLQRPQADFASYLYDPAELRKLIQDRNWKTVAAFQTRNPIHRAHEYIQKCALELVDGLLLHPLVGETKAEDIPASIRIQSYELMLAAYYPKQRAVMGVFPAAMRYAGPREALFHAICRKNYGCTHMIVGRDHAGVGSYYGTYDAQQLLCSIDPDDLGIVPLCFDNAFYCKACGNMATAKTCPHDTAQHVILSGTKVREMLRQGVPIPVEFTRPEVSALLRNYYMSE